MFVYCSHDNRTSFYHPWSARTVSNTFPTGMMKWDHCLEPQSNGNLGNLAAGEMSRDLDFVVFRGGLRGFSSLGTIK